MVPAQPYAIEYEPEAIGHIRVLERKLQGLVFDEIDEQLGFEPLTQTRNRKPLRSSTIFGPETWELRFGPGNRLRAFYRADAPAGRVYVKGVGIKERNCLRMGGEEVSL
jgi:hypothetical protein